LPEKGYPQDVIPKPAVKRRARLDFAMNGVDDAFNEVIFFDPIPNVCRPH
jgi:hypothetical protein